MSRAGLTVRKKSAALLQVINIYSPKNTYDAVYLSNYATINVIDPLARIKGVGQVTLFGPLDYSLRIWLDPDRLTELNLTPNDVITAVQSQNVQAALGRIGAAPTASEQQLQITIKTKGRLTRPEEFAAHRAARQSRRLGGSGQRRRPRRDGRAIAGSLQPLQRRPRRRDRHLPVAGLQRSRCGEASPRHHEYARDALPRRSHLYVFFDTTVFVTATIVEVVRTLVIAIVLVGIVVFLFLGKLRTTLIPLVAVPVSIIGTFAVLLVIGYSANTVSLLALVLAIGIVVDDAIVVVENIERVIEEEPELTMPDACKKAMAEITGPILAITLVLLSVFVPVAFIPGISGQLFRQFAVAVSVSMLISALNALTLEPGAVRACCSSAASAAAARCAMCSARSTKCATAMSAAVRRLVRRVGDQRRRRGRRAGGLRAAVQQSRRRAFCRTRIRARSSPLCGCRKALRSTAPRRWSSRSRTSSGRSPASKACCRWSG